MKDTAEKSLCKYHATESTALIHGTDLTTGENCGERAASIALLGFKLQDLAANCGRFPIKHGERQGLQIIKSVIEMPVKYCLGKIDQSADIHKSLLLVKLAHKEEDAFRLFW